MEFRMNRANFSTQHQAAGLCNDYAKCFLRGRISCFKGLKEGHKLWVFGVLRKMSEPTRNEVKGGKENYIEFP
jgi:hypothetical protein